MATPTLEPFDVRSAPDAAYERLWHFERQMRAEREPDAPELSLEVFIARTRNLPSFLVVESRTARGPDGAIVGWAQLAYLTTDENAHLGQIRIEVLPAARRAGLGRALLGWAAGAAQATGRRLLISATMSSVPAGEAFAEAAGAKRALEDRISQLVLADVDRGLLRAWQERAHERAADFELIFWENEYPEEHLPAFAKLSEVMNSAPHGEVEIEAERWTPERLRDWLASRRSGGAEIWTLVARERSSGALAGFSEIVREPARPDILHQGATAVEPAYRNRGLGRWLKAAMLERVLRELPEARVIRTGNAEVNAPMLAINEALGFRPHLARSMWQIEVERALAFAAS